jgi:hypothetical protein
VIPPGGEAQANGAVIGDDEGESEHATLLESTVPLRAADSLGRQQAVDLSLEHSEGELQPANPLVDVNLPQELGEGIELPDAGVQIELVDAPGDRAPSTIDQSVAAYPEVAKDTVLAVAPMPTGVETLTLLQSAAAPRTETFRLDLPEGATLQEAEGGGAEVLSGDEVLVMVEPPTAIDAEGRPVPVALEVSGDSITLQVSPDESATFPILVDPVYDTFNWNGVTTTSGNWATVSNSPNFSGAKSAYCSNTPGAVNQCGTPLTQNTPGLYTSASSGGSLSTGSWVQQTYFVPRAGSDYYTYGVLPSSFIESMTINHIGYWHRSDPSASPYLAAGIWAGSVAPVWGGNPEWASLLTWGANQGDINETLQFTFPGNNNHNAKEALVGMVAVEPHVMTAYRDSLFREVQIAIGDVDKPAFGSISSPSSWMDQGPAMIGFTVSDSGLGVSSITTTDRQTPQHSWTTSANCPGTNDKPCPHTWKSTDVGGTILKYDPLVLPTGISTLDIKATDPVGNVSSSAAVPVKVDHTSPALSLTGTMTEQATLGISRPRYILKAEASDGTQANPQSGVASVKISVDGQQVQLNQPGCSTQNCQVTNEWTLYSGSYAPGSHTVTILATDAVGRSTTKNLTIEIQPDTTKPSFGMGGEVQAAPGSWVDQRNYTVYVGAGDSGYGVTKVQFLIDGAVANGGSAKQPCPGGGCSLNKTFTINMAAYSGGEHTATVIVTDGAGNKAEVSNPIRVNPSGDISAAEAAKTLEAADITSGDSVLSPPIPRESGLPNSPALEADGESIATIGTDVTSVMTTDGADGVTIEAPEGDIHFEPVDTGSSNTPVEVVAGAAGVSGNVQSEADSVIRPVFDGVMTFAAIRSAEAPEEYSWTVELGEGQTLEATSDEGAEVYYEDGEPALQILAQAAHDATGANVPTSLSVSEGNVVTLTVHHRKGEGQPSYVYPIVGGAQFETGYEAVVVTSAPIAKEEEEAAAAELVKLEQELQEAEELQRQQEWEELMQEWEEVLLEWEELQNAAGMAQYWESAEPHVSAPEPIPSGEASISTVGGSRRTFVEPICGHSSFYPRPDESYTQACGNPFTGDTGHAVVWHAAMRGSFLYKPGAWAEQRDARACDQAAYQNSLISLYYVKEAWQCRYGPATSDGNGGQKVSAGHYLRAQAHWEVGHRGHCGDECNGTPNPTFWEDKALELHLWPSGKVEWAVPSP